MRGCPIKARAVPKIVRPRRAQALTEFAGKIGAVDESSLGIEETASPTSQFDWGRAFHISTLERNADFSRLQHADNSPNDRSREKWRWLHRGVAERHRYVALL